MDAKLLKLGLGAIFLISLASLGAIILFINPHNAGWLNLALFTVVVFMLVFSLSSWLGFWVRKNFITERNQDRIFKMIFRQGAWVAILLAAYLWLNHFRLFKVFTVLAVLFLIIGLEYYFLVRHEYRNKITGS
ncbi:MAG: hypothetical protein WAP55_02955 [Minisyncoccia bacterium]